MKRTFWQRLPTLMLIALASVTVGAMLAALTRAGG